MKPRFTCVLVILAVSFAVCGSPLAALIEVKIEVKESPPTLIPKDLLPLVNTAKDIATIFSGITDAIKLGQLIGIFPTDHTVENKLNEISKDLQTIGAVIYNHDTELKRLDYIVQAVTAAQQAEIAAAENPPRHLPIAGDNDNDSLEAVNALFASLLFQQAFFDPSVNDGGTEWKSFIPGPTVAADRTIYDWRLNIPHLMEVIALRLKVMTNVHPEWRLDGKYDGHLRSWAEELRSHLNMMLRNVHCSISVVAFQVNPSHRDDPVHFPLYDVKTLVGCADASTGISRVETVYQVAFPGQGLYPEYPVAYLGQTQ